MFYRILNTVLAKNILPGNEELFPFLQKLFFTKADRQTNNLKFWESKNPSVKKPRSAAFLKK